jgi:YcaO-like protein with predicted kinase domain
VWDPTKTYDNIVRFMPHMGITRIANITGLDYLGIPVVTVCRPNSRSIAVSQGKGSDLISAVVSGLMESMETFHAERITNPIKFTSFSELVSEGAATANIDKLLRTSESPFAEEKSLFWIAGQNLVNDETVWVPFEMVHTNYTLPRLPGTGFFFGSTNGLASGNHFVEAVNHAIAEIVERDCIELWKRTDEETRAEKKIDISTITDELSGTILERFVSVGLAVAIWEITSDVGIPAFYCWVADGPDSDFLVPGIGSGCHPVRSIAMSRALTEAAQMRLTLISGSRDDLTWEDYRSGITHERGRRFREQINATRGRKDFRIGADHHCESFEQELNWQVSRLLSSGVEEIIAVDLTQSQRFDIAVVRVVIPGLECEDGYQLRPRASVA